MNYQFLVDQIEPEQRRWHFEVCIDPKTFREKYERPQHQFHLEQPSWPYATDSWENIIYQAALDALQDRFGMDNVLSFGSGGPFSGCTAPSQFKKPTVKTPEFELLLLDS